jgi:hypothetical protein
MKFHIRVLKVIKNYKGIIGGVAANFSALPLL